MKGNSLEYGYTQYLSIDKYDYDLSFVDYFPENVGCELVRIYNDGREPAIPYSNGEVGWPKGFNDSYCKHNVRNSIENYTDEGLLMCQGSSSYSYFQGLVIWVYAFDK